MSRKALSDTSILVSTFETLRDGVSILDLEFNIVKVNSIMQQWHPESQLVGKKCYEVYHRRTTPCEVCPARETMETGDIAYKLQQKRHNGKHYWLDIYTFPLIDPSTRETIGVVEFFRDVTDQKETQEALRFSEARYRTLVENIPAVTYIAPSHDYRRTLFVSPQVGTLLGLPQADFETDPELWEKLLYSEDQEWVLAEIDRCQDTGEPFSLEYRLRSKDGRILWVHDAAWLVRDNAGQPLFLQGVVQDITGRKQAEAAFFQEQEKYRTLAESAPLGISIIGKDGHYKYLNPKFVEMFGYSQEEIPTGREWFDKAYPDPAQRSRAISDWKIYLEESQFGETEPRTFTINCKDGSTKIINFRAVPLEEGDQFLLYEDITERLHAVAALRDSEEKYRLLVQQIPALVFKGYKDWSIDCFDNKIEELTGYPPEDFNSRRLKWRDLIPEEELPEVKQVFQDALKEDGSYLREHRIRKKNGEYAWVQCRGRIFCDQTGEIKHINGVTFDITSRKKAEQALQESEERYRLMAERVSDVIWTADLDLRLTYVSPSIQQMLGLAPEEIVGKAIGEILPPASLGRALEVLNQEMAKEKSGLTDQNRSRVLELDEIHKNGTIIKTEVKASFIRDADNQPRGILGVTRDITKRKRAEEALRRREAVLEAVSFAAEKFLGDTGWEDYIEEILGHLGQAIEAYRVSIFENRKSSHGTELTCRYEWLAKGVTTCMPDPQLQGISYEDAGLARWENILSQNKVIFGDVEGFLPAEQELWTILKIKSILVLPIFVGQEWWGFIAFGDYRRRRSWSSLEVDALLTAVNTLGAAILHSQSERALRESEGKLRSLSNQLLHAQENERKRLASELHNVLGHDLLLLKLKLESLHSDLTPEQITQKKEIQNIVTALQGSVRNVRRLYQYLSPGDLEDLGLATALRLLVENFARAQKLELQTDLDDFDDLFEMPVQTTIYRTVQECLTNTGKHAEANKLWFRAKLAGAEVSFGIEDDGKGFNVKKALAAKNTLGLLTMEERVKNLGGTIEIVSQERRGTTISFTIPVPNKESRT